MSGDRYALRAEGVRKVFGRREVLTNASVWAGRGEVTTLLGRNGSGKSTLLRIACGLLRPDQGTVTLAGRVVLRPRLAAMARRGLVFVPQGRSLVQGYTVSDHFAAVSAVYGSEAERAAIDTMDVAELMGQRASTLSGGERARVALGLALATRPTVLVADEPLVGLAPIDQERIGQLLRAVAATGVAVVTSGHDVAVLMEISDAIIWSVAGTTHHVGSPAEAGEHHQFRREYLGPRPLP